MRRSVSFVMALLILLPPLVARALESDRKQPIEIQADRAQLDEKTGEARYEGQVVLTQGTLSIHADTLTIVAGANNALERVNAEGNPAQFSQVPETGKPPVTAKASRIDYRVKDEVMLLQGDAVVVQNDNVFQGDRIEYDIPHQRMQASSTAGAATTKRRVKMILPPTAEAPPSPENSP